MRIKFFSVKIKVCDIIKNIKTRVGDLKSTFGSYDLAVQKDNFLCRPNELVNFPFMYDELKDKYCHTNAQNAIDPIRVCLNIYFLKLSLIY